MTNSERIQASNAELREAIEMAENLPDAGGGAPATIGENLHDVSTDVLDTYIDGASIIGYAGWDLTDYIPVKGGKYYIIYSNGSIKSDYFSMFDENKVYKEKLSGNIISTDLKLPIFVTVKNNGYVRLSGAHTQISVMKFYEVLNFNFEVPDDILENAERMSRMIETIEMEDYPDITGG